MIELVNGNIGAQIRANEDGFYTVIAVNVRDGFNSDSIVTDGRSHPTEAAARRWAAKTIAAHAV